MEKLNNIAKKRAHSTKNKSANVNRWEETWNKENDPNNNGVPQFQNESSNTAVIVLNQNDPDDALLIDNADLPLNVGMEYSVLDYFGNVQQDGERVKATCSICSGVYSAGKTSFSNFRSHLKVIIIFQIINARTIHNSYSMFFTQRKHREIYNEYELKSSAKRRKKNTSNGGLTQERFDNVLRRFLINGMHTFSIVEQPEFRNYTYCEITLITFSVQVIQFTFFHL